MSRIETDSVIFKKTEEMVGEAWSRESWQWKSVLPWREGGERKERMLFLGEHPVSLLGIPPTERWELFKRKEGSSREWIEVLRLPLDTSSLNFPAVAYFLRGELRGWQEGDLREKIGEVMKEIGSKTASATPSLLPEIKISRTFSHLLSENDLSFPLVGGVYLTLSPQGMKVTLLKKIAFPLSADERLKEKVRKISQKCLEEAVSLHSLFLREENRYLWPFVLFLWNPQEKKVAFAVFVTLHHFV